MLKPAGPIEAAVANANRAVVDAGEKIGRSVYAVSRSGLQVVEKDGKVTNVYSNPDWMKSK